jgi:poly(3-hydroxybutyrate) depolymerase
MSAIRQVADEIPTVRPRQVDAYAVAGRSDAGLRRRFWRYRATVSRKTASRVTGPGRKCATPLARFALSVLTCTAVLASPVAGAFDTLEIEVNGVSRSARVYPGTNADRTASPLVIVFHGLADSAWNFADIVGFHEQWPEATVVYPQGLPRADRGGSRGWHGFRDNDENDDLAFVDALLERITDRYRVDSTRMYVTGFSNGGHMTFNLLMDRPCRFAAFAPIGALAEYVAGAPTPRPVLYLFGQGEPKEYSDPWAHTVVALAKLNHASGEKREWAPGLTEFVPGPGGAVTIYGQYRAGHVWPSNGNEIIVRFFREHRLDASGACAPAPVKPPSP